jgi:predicted metal-dependent hydrolase
METVQLRLPWSTPPAPPREPRHVVVDGVALVLEIARHRRARRYVLRMTDRGTLRLTVPRGASIAGGVHFVERQARWIRRERVRRAERAAAWGEGTLVWFDGERVPLSVGTDSVRLASLDIPIAERTGDVRTTIEAHLRGMAARELPERLASLAAAASLHVAKIGVRSQRTRWGSCSTRGVIMLNWRLIQLPPWVRDYVLFHELAHLRQPNHSRRFWREVERLCPDWRTAERWLRAHGREVL